MSIKNKTDKKIKLKFIEADFSKFKSLDDYRQKIFNEVKNLDIGIVVLNAAVNYDGPFEKLRDQEV